VILLSGNITGKTLTAPVFIFQLANQFKPEEAAAVAPCVRDLLRARARREPAGPDRPQDREARA